MITTYCADGIIFWVNADPIPFPTLAAAIDALVESLGWKLDPAIQGVN